MEEQRSSTGNSRYCCFEVLSTDLPDLSRLIKSDLLSILRELLRQDLCPLAIHVLSTLRSEYSGQIDLGLYADVISGLSRNKLCEHIDKLIEDLEKDEGGIQWETDKGLLRVIRGVVDAGRRESAVKICEILRRSGCGETWPADEYVVGVLSKGLRRMGETELASEVDEKFGGIFRVKNTNFISRVNQFDAARLDIEMSAMLKEQLVKVFSLMKFSIWVDKPTPGNALMNLRYRDDRAVVPREKVRTGLEGPGLTMAQKLWYCIATVGGQYIWARLQTFSAFRRWGDSEQRPLARRAWILIQRIEGLYKAASFGNLLIFLFTGRFRNLVERVLRARLVYGHPNMNRAVSFEYMNRQLVWNEFSEMLLLLLPLLNSSSIKNLLSPFSKDKSSSSAGDDGTCPVCQAIPTIPFLALPCQHRYCYYCLRTRCAASSSFRCPSCSEPVHALGNLSSDHCIRHERQEVVKQIGGWGGWSSCRILLKTINIVERDTDTASVLLEAIGYIRFLQGQIEALSSPYLGTASSNMRNQQSVQGERNSVFPEDPGQDSNDKPKDLSRGLCLVPVSCTQHVGSDNGADYWAPAIGGGF
ncbi:hypothetical protein GH714_020739 [Hevea brasiliensis]|uniref:RING-type E3 ubiquitin transferase (cysteine targeting) n=1 Tax=Hevea brasiliensis TaxID=3981 RepID=A0A6A6LIB2_HEVBR|nr:hypothetical protein GH714_020739 [Hevea brasiliensis]